MKINWYPGHMAKTKRLMQEDIRQIDLVCELLDARIPWASRNPDLSALAGQKKRIIVLNRADQADPQQTDAPQQSEAPQEEQDSGAPEQAQ